MIDLRIAKAAKILVDYSTRVKKGENVLISLQSPEGAPLAREVYRRVMLKGAYPRLRIGLPGLPFIYYTTASKSQLKHFPKIAWYEIKNTNVVIAIGAEYNPKELSKISPKKIAMKRKSAEKISKWQTEKTRWVLFEYPTVASAKEAGMSLSQYKKFVFGATNINWKKHTVMLGNLAKIVNKTKKVRIVGKNTDLEFSIAGRNAMSGTGNFNMPDAEVWTAPIRNSANGHIEFSYPAIYSGNEVKKVRLEFRNGKVVKATAEKNQKFLRGMLATDKGASYLGEFGIGCNFSINRFTKNILFDEKIGGTIHLALGNAYKENKGKSKQPLNVSAQHWDMIKDLRQGGRIYFDDKLVQKNGKFLVKI